MYRYYQTSEHSTWEVGEDTNPNDPWEFSTKHKACRVSILTVDNPNIPSSNYKYEGMFFVDIDGDLNEAIESGKNFCEKLISFGVPVNDIEIHLSGKKGVHIYLESWVFDKAKISRSNLPALHKWFALTLYVPCLDMQVYSSGKGRLIRTTNALRPDGHYKVRITYDELRSMTEAEYVQLTSAPRNKEFAAKSYNLAPKLAEVFIKGEQQLTISEKVRRESIIVHDFAIMDGAVPNCIEDLARKGRNSSTNFNIVAINVACWSLRSGMSRNIIDSIYDRIVDKNPSHKGVPVRVRKSSLLGAEEYIKNHMDEYKFSCSAIRATLASSPCEGCPVKGSSEQSKRLIESFLLYEAHGSWHTDKDCTRLISTFTLSREYVILDENSERAVSSVITMILPMLGATHRLKDFDESGWQNKTNFKKEISGIDGAAYFGDDNGVTRMRLTIAKDEILLGTDMKTITRSNKIGINYRKRKGSDSPMAEDHVGRLTYIEKDFSINNSSIMNTHQLVGDPSSVPKLRMMDWSNPLSEKANKAFGLLTKCNHPETVSTMLGWYLLAHLKTHVYQVFNKGILLSVSGVAGTGKNSFIAVLQRLAGLEGESAMYTVEAPNSTKLPLQLAVTSSCTIPRVLNEMNPKSVSMSRYQELIELMKATYDSQIVSRGVIGGGDRATRGANVSTVDAKITAPLVTLSEEPINEPAILQRAIRIDMTPAGRDAGAKYFRELEPLADYLVEISLRLVIGALNTSVKEVGHAVNNTVLPSALELQNVPLRLRFGYQCIIMAYDWAIKVLSETDTGLSSENIVALKTLKNVFIESITEGAGRIAIASNVTEADKVVKDLAVMAHYGNDPKINWSLQKGVHFVILEGKLYLDMLLIYPMYVKYKQGSPTGLSVKTVEAFMNIVRSMEYYVSDQALVEFLPTAGRPVLSLDIEKLQDSNIPVTLFM